MWAATWRPGGGDGRGDDEHAVDRRTRRGRSRTCAAPLAARHAMIDAHEISDVAMGKPLLRRESLTARSRCAATSSWTRCDAMPLAWRLRCACRRSAMPSPPPSPRPSPRARRCRRRPRRPRRSSGAAGGAQEVVAAVLEDDGVQGPRRLPAVGDAAPRRAAGRLRRAPYLHLLRRLDRRLRVDRVGDADRRDGVPAVRQGHGDLQQGVQGREPHAAVLPRQHAGHDGVLLRRPQAAQEGKGGAKKGGAKKAGGAKKSPPGKGKGGKKEEDKGAEFDQRSTCTSSSTAWSASASGAQPAVGLQVQQEGVRRCPSR